MVRLPDPARSQAVLVGAGAYAHEELPDLPAAVRNVGAFGRLLVTAASCVDVIDPPGVGAVLDPLRAAALQAEDMLLVYFAGHGLLFGRGQDLHLAVSGSDPEKPWTAVPYTQVAEVVRDSDAAVKVVILDCCFSGRATGVPLIPMAVSAGVVAQVDVEGVYVITSSPATRPSYVPAESAFTSFTGFLLDELTATAGGADSPLPLAGLFERVRRRMRAAGLPEPQQYNTNTAAQLALVSGHGAPGFEADGGLGRDGSAAAKSTTTSSDAAKPTFSRRLALGGGASVLGLGLATLLLRDAYLDNRGARTTSSPPRANSSPPTNPPSMVLVGHTEPAWGVAFTHNGTMLASCGGDSVVRLWTMSGDKVGTLYGHVGAVWGLTFNETDTILASSGGDATIKLWDTATHQPLRNFTGHEDWVETIAFSPYGRTLASGSYDGTVRIWDSGTDAPRVTLTGHESPVLGVAFSPTGAVLASVGKDGRVRVWNTTTWRPVRVIAGHEGAAWGVAFSPDGTVLASCGEDRKVRLWAVETGAPLAVLSGHSNIAVKAAYRRTGDWLATSSDDSTIRIWETATSKSMGVLTGHTASVRGVAFHPTSKVLASASGDNTIRLWDLSKFPAR